MTTWEELGEELHELAFDVLDLALESLQGGGPMTPFAVVVLGSERTLHRFVAETLEGGLEQGRALLGRLPDVGQAALAYDGYWTREGMRSDAVYVQVHERGRPASGTIAQRYTPGPVPEVVGNPADVGDSEPLLGAGGSTKKRGLFRSRPARD